MQLLDPLRQLQVAARLAADHVAPGERAGRVVVFDARGAKVLDVAVPVAVTELVKEREPTARAVAAGWVVTDKGAWFDGTPVPVALSRLRLLRTLVEAETPLTSKELTQLAFDRHTDEANTRYHIRELKRELKSAFTFDGDVIQGDGDGYRLVIR